MATQAPVNPGAASRNGRPSLGPYFVSKGVTTLHTPVNLCLFSRWRNQSSPIVSSLHAEELARASASISQTPARDDSNASCDDAIAPVTQTGSRNLKSASAPACGNSAMRFLLLPRGYSLNTLIQVAAMRETLVILDFAISWTHALAVTVTRVLLSRLYMR